MNAESIARDGRARREVLEQLARAHEAFTNLEQRMLLERKVIEAAGAHEMGTRVLRAWIAEADDPEPPRKD